MSNRYRVEVGHDEPDKGWNGEVLKVLRDGQELWRQEDAGEPEDNLFTRDYKWVKPALEEAYRLGFEDGASQNNPPEHVPSVTDMFAFGKVDEAFGDD